jgi:hypothetical protein
MAARKYTGEELISAVRQIGMIPDTGSTGTEDADILKYINEAVSVYLVPRLLKTRENYFIQRERTTLGSSTRYVIPHRALYQKLRDVFYIDSSDNRYVLVSVPPGHRTYYSESGAVSPIGYFLEGNYVVLVPEDTTGLSGSLEFVYFSRPGEVVKTTSCGVISSVNTGTKVITCTADVSALFSAGDSLDVHSPNSGGELRQWDLTVSLVSTTDVTVAEEIDGSVFGTTALAAGDYVCLAEEAALPALPREFHPIIARAAAVSVSEAIGDVNGIKVHTQLFEQQLHHALGATESRVEGKPMRLGGFGGFV